jgi:hypothetical protein
MILLISLTVNYFKANTKKISSKTTFSYTKPKQSQMIETGMQWKNINMSLSSLVSILDGTLKWLYCKTLYLVIIFPSMGEIYYK